MICFENVSFGYGLKRNIINGLNLVIPGGSRICLTGRSGCGKTTILRILMGLESPRNGKLTGAERIAFSAVFQNDRLIPHETVLRNVALFSNEGIAQRMLMDLGLEANLQSIPPELSGGMKRRVALARALCHTFDILVLDEAFTGLDEETKNRCLALTDRIVGDKTLVMVTHDAREAAALHAVLIPIEKFTVQNEKQI